MFSSGIRLWPPASRLESSAWSARNSNVLARSCGSQYAKGAGFTRRSYRSTGAVRQGTFPSIRAGNPARGDLQRQPIRSDRICPELLGIVWKPQDCFELIRQALETPDRAHARHGIQMEPGDDRPIEVLAGVRGVAAKQQPATARAGEQDRAVPGAV